MRSWPPASSPNLVAGGRQAGGTTIDHVDCAGSVPEYYPPQPLQTDPNGQVFKAIVVEVTRGQCSTKVVAPFGLPGNAVAVLAPKPVSLTRELCHGLAGGQKQNGYEGTDHGALSAFTELLRNAVVRDRLADHTGPILPLRG